MIGEVLDDLEQRFSDIDVLVDFRSIPIFVVDEPTRGGIDIAGLCRGAGKRIILDRRLFNIEEENDKITLLWWTILHELGHCYFGRGHLKTYTYAEESKVFHLKTEQKIPEEFTYVCKLESSVMFPGITMASSLMPAFAKPYYIHEMAREHYKTESLDYESVSLKDFEFYTDRESALVKGYKLNKDCNTGSSGF
jgi:hypothetical protein